MSILGGLVDLVAIGIPEFLGEFLTDAVLRAGRGRWQRVAAGNRRRTEEAVRFLRRYHVSAWVRPAGRTTYEVVVRTDQSEIARGLLNAPSAGWRPT